MPIKALILDFDSTISTPTFLERLQVWAVADKHEIFKIMTRDERIANFGGQPRIDTLAALLASLKEAGVALYIVSIGFKIAIVPHLETAELKSYFKDECIFGQDSKELRGFGFVKGKLIAQIMRGKNWQHDEVLFVDDSVEHIEKAKSVCQTLLVAPASKSTVGGMAAAEFEAIRKAAFS